MNGGWHSSIVKMVGSVHAPNWPMKSCMPNMAKIAWMARTTATTFRQSGIAWASEPTINFMPGSRAMRRKGRNTRRIRNVLSGCRKANCGSASAARVSSEAVTIEKSSEFHHELR